MEHAQFLAKGAGQGAPAFWIVASALVVIVGAAFLVSRVRKR
ncbi:MULTISPECIES: hypothetical protein [Streptomyces]|nr:MULTISPECIES: hypothetical protein [unclassified Streptomyces]